MTIENALKMVEKEYEKAKTMPYVKKPLAWALFQVWKKVDREVTNEIHTRRNT